MKTFKDLSSIDLLLLPHKVKTRCILKAKTDEAKRRLVLLVILAVTEDVKRIFIRGYK